MKKEWSWNKCFMEFCLKLFTSLLLFVSQPAEWAFQTEKFTFINLSMVVWGISFSMTSLMFSDKSYLIFHGDLHASSDWCSISEYVIWVVPSNHVNLSHAKYICELYLNYKSLTLLCHLGHQLVLFWLFPLNKGGSGVMVNHKELACLYLLAFPTPM